MKTVVRRLRRIEDQLGPKMQPDYVRNPRQRFLTEMVRLDGSRTALGEEELERFVASFPVQMAGCQVVP
jgi:hypothetical protein